MRGDGSWLEEKPKYCATLDRQTIFGDGGYNWPTCSRNSSDDVSIEVMTYQACDHGPDFCTDECFNSHCLNKVLSAVGRSIIKPKPVDDPFFVARLRMVEDELHCEMVNAIHNVRAKNNEFLDSLAYF